MEVGSSNLAARWQLESAISTSTAALLYVKSHHCVQKGMLGIEDFAQAAQRHNLPLIVDAARAVACITCGATLETPRIVILPQALITCFSPSC